jgi:hypothetical protein
MAAELFDLILELIGVVFVIGAVCSAAAAVWLVVGTKGGFTNMTLAACACVAAVILFVLGDLFSDAFDEGASDPHDRNRVIQPSHPYGPRR